MPIAILFVVLVGFAVGEIQNTANSPEQDKWINEHILQK